MIDMFEMMSGILNALTYIGAVGGLTYIADRMGISLRISDEK
ncbi:hypothetical protein SAMN05421752_11292 [Natronorubrum thiooxidans]|uniref:Uncharacterized protein n=1 Tax=Natronorubrum thiooxidans TaxID=308853 RepID=A0A1N7GI59_9EURY|nr:hypothetical protein SAMN05421752_11292 [Natronorubrum thiooxidans]